MRWLMPWSASSGAQRSARAMPAPSRTRAARARAGAVLFGDDVLKGGPRQYREKGVVQREKCEVAARVLGDRRPDPADDDREREGQEEEWQEQLAGPACGRDGREQRADGADTQVREGDGGDGRRVEALVEEPERRHGDDLDEQEKRQRGQELADPDGA